MTIPRLPRSRRSQSRWRVMALVLVACSAFAACGSQEGSDTSSPSTAPDGDFPVTIEHKYGNTEITQAPERVVTVGLSDHDYVLALGVEPVGVTEWYGEYPSATWPWAQDELGDATPEVVGDAAELNYEQIAALRPDVIIGLYSGLTEDQYETLARIAPTVAQDGRFVDYGMPWEEMSLTIGRILGQEEQAKELISEIKTRLDEEAEQHPEFAGTSAVVAYPGTDGKIGIYSPQDPRSRFLTELGFTIPNEIAELTGDSFYAEISPEQIQLLDHDVLVWYAGGGLGPDLRTDLANNQLYQELGVVKRGGDLIMDELPGDALSWSTVLSLPFAIDRLVPQLAAVADDDPATKPTPTS